MKCQTKLSQTLFTTHEIYVKVLSLTCYFKLKHCLNHIVTILLILFFTEIPLLCEKGIIIIIIIIIISSSSSSIVC